MNGGDTAAFLWPVIGLSPAVSLKLTKANDANAHGASSKLPKTSVAAKWHDDCKLEQGEESAAFRAQQRVFSKGGSRNRRDRTSEIVTLAQARDVLEASDRAQAMGKPFNRFTTISLSLLGIPDSLATRAIGRFVKLASDWLATKGEKLLWVWVREIGRKYGSHVHLLFHLPPELAGAFNKLQPGWIRVSSQIRAGARARLGRLEKGSVFTLRIGGSLGAYQTKPEAFASDLRNVLSYVLKGAAPDTILALGLVQPHKPQGVIMGKRVGWWQDRQPNRLPIPSPSRAHVRVED